MTKVTDWKEFSPNIHYRRVGECIEMVSHCDAKDFSVSLPAGFTVDYTKIAPGADISRTVYVWELELKMEQELTFLQSMLRKLMIFWKINVPELHKEWKEKVYVLDDLSPPQVDNMVKATLVSTTTHFLFPTIES